jgi:ribosome maturation factor RimP
VLRVIVDRDGGVDLDAVAEISREISGALDAADVMGPVPYVLEVSSPGVDRPLVRPAHWRRAADRLVRIELRSGEVVEGRVMSIDDSGVLLVAGAREIRLPFADVVRAQVQVEFSGVGAPDELGSDGEEGR